MLLTRSSSSTATNVTINHHRITTATAITHQGASGTEGRRLW
jgi:hypothetical protein